jgi:hypothetical protein
VQHKNGDCNKCVASQYSSANKKNVSKGVELYVNRKPQVTFMLVLNEFLHDINLGLTSLLTHNELLCSFITSPKDLSPLQQKITAGLLL